MEVRRLLIGEEARRRAAVFRGAKSLESFLNDRRVFAMIVAMHLYVRRADVHLTAAVLQRETQSDKKCTIIKHNSYRHVSENRLKVFIYYNISHTG